MRRREFIALLAAACPLAAQAQQLKRIGVLTGGGPFRAGVEGLREGLRAAGLQEGREVHLSVRETDRGAAAAVARDFERDGFDLIVAWPTSVAAAARGATTRVPIVFAAGSDPVSFGLVDSIARPGGRVTGVHFVTADHTEKRLQLLLEIMPTIRRIITFYDPGNPIPRPSVAALRATARLLGVTLIEHHATSPEAVRDHLRALRRGEVDAYFFVNDIVAISQEKLILDTATALGIPTMALQLDLVRTGALAGYGLDFRQLGRLAATYVSRILAGTHPGDLPVEAVRPALAVNLKTAHELGVRVPQAILLSADELIE